MSTRVRFSQEIKNSLEFKTDLAYQTLEQAVQNPEKPWILSTARVLYTWDLGNDLQSIVPVREIVALCKGEKRKSAKINKYILQFLLMSDSTPEGGFEGFPDQGIIVNPEDGMGGLSAFIDANDAESCKLGVVYRLMQKKGMELRTQGRYDLILSAMRYIREN